MEDKTERLPTKEEFETKLNELLQDKQGTTWAFMSKDEYNRNIQETKDAKKMMAEKRKGVTAAQRMMARRRLHRFAILEVDGVERLIVPPKKSDKEGETKLVFYVSNDELYEIIKDAHVVTGHGGRHRVLAQVKPQYKNVPEEAVVLFKSLCGVCLGNETVEKKGLTVKPMVFKQANDRWQIDLIDWQSSPDNDYKFIATIQDHLTKFTFLRPLASKRADEVARTLLPIMLCFGAPCVLQSDNGREFCNEVINSLRDTWPELKIVHGTPRHSQSQGSVERANRDVQEMLTAWMRTNSTRQWSMGLDFVANQKNRSIHQGTGRSPYQAMFGTPMRVGITSMIPAGLVPAMETEEELDAFMQGIQSSSPQASPRVDSPPIAPGSSPVGRAVRRKPTKNTKTPPGRTMQQKSPVTTKNTKTPPGRTMQQKSPVTTKNTKTPPGRTMQQKSPVTTKNTKTPPGRTMQQKSPVTTKTPRGLGKSKVTLSYGKRKSPPQKSPVTTAGARSKKKKTSTPPTTYFLDTTQSSPETPVLPPTSNRTSTPLQGATGVLESSERASPEAESPSYFTGWSTSAGDDRPSTSHLTCSLCGKRCAFNELCASEDCIAPVHKTCAAGGLCPLCHRAQNISTPISISISTSHLTCSLCGKRCAFNELCASEDCMAPVHKTCAAGGLCPLCHRAQNISASQRTAREGLVKQAAKMTGATERKFPPAKVGDTVVVPIPELDRAKCDPRNVTAVILEVLDGGFYRVGNQHGVLERLLARNQFGLAKEQFLRVDDVPRDKTIALRAMSAAAGMSGGQGFLKCNCKQNCTTKRCSCRNSGRLCNSKCHNSSACTNK